MFIVKALFSTIKKNYGIYKEKVVYFFVKIGVYDQSMLAYLVRRGVCPPNKTEDEVFKALKATKSPNPVEMFGFLSAQVFDKFGNLKQDLGLQSVAQITTVFAELLVDGLCDSSVCADLDHFIFHAQGAGSSAEGADETGMVDEKGIKVAGSQTHGTSSDIYQSVCTIAATTVFGCREHGMFDTLTGGNLLDRSLVTNIALNTDDEVAWTYNLTVNSGG